MPFSDRVEAGRRTPSKGVHVQPDGSTLVFLTVVTHHGERWLSNPKVQTALHQVWEYDAVAWLVGDYLLMPEHVHLFCAPGNLGVEIERWVAFWKDRLAKACPEAGRWQRGGFHHRLRSRAEFDEKWSYVGENPLRRGLVGAVDDWPYQGRVFPVGWI